MGAAHDSPPIPPGAIDLNSPVLKSAREFSTTLATAHATAVIMLGVSDTGQLMLSMEVPGGPIHALGLLAAASALLAPRPNASPQ